MGNEVVEPLFKNKQHTAVTKDFYMMQSSSGDFDLPEQIKVGAKQSKYIFDLGLRRESKILEYMRAVNAAAMYAEQ